MIYPDPFKNRTAVSLTKHQREDVIIAVLEKTGMNLIIGKYFATDLSGTITKEIERRGSKLETAQAKALKAIDISVSTIGIASKGNFGSHSFIFFAHADYELVSLVDVKNKI